MPGLASPSRAGRPRGFEESAVLDSAEQQFAALGFHATSVADLVVVTGLHKGSLYAAFGGKHDLFITVLTRYAARRLEMLDRDLDAASPLAGIGRYLERQTAEAVRSRGCLLANSALELLPGDDEVLVIVEKQHQEIQERLTAALRRAADEGEIDAQRATPGYARCLFAMVEGLWELGRASNDVAPMLEAAFALLRPARLPATVQPGLLNPTR